MLPYNNIVQHNPVNWSISAWPLFTFIWPSCKACSNLIYWLQSVNCWSNLSSHTGPLSFTVILSEKVSMADPLSSVLDDVLRLDKILSTDGGVLIIDQICLVIPDPRRFPDDHQPLLGMPKFGSVRFYEVFLWTANLNLMVGRERVELRTRTDRTGFGRFGSGLNQVRTLEPT
jgi:hypothetical protein